MRFAIVRFYTNKKGKVERHLQGKVFKPKGYDFHIFYRDLTRYKSTLWQTRYKKGIESESFNLDHLVWSFLLKENIPQIHYYLKTRKKLLVATTERVERHIGLGNVKTWKLNNHTQIFIPERLFEEREKDYSAPWIKREISVDDLLKEKEKELEKGRLMPYEVRQKLAKLAKRL